MNQSNSQPEKQKDRRYDPELLKKGLRCDLDQYEMLMRCSEKKDLTEWNEWRFDNPNEDILLQGADVAGRYLNGVLLSTNTTGAKSPFSGTVHLERALMWEATFCRASLRGANIEGANLQRSNLERTTLEKANLEGADLSESHMIGAFLKDAYLLQANLTKVNSKGANFQRANLESANLEGANLENTFLWEANLQGANLRETNLQGAILKRADIRGAEFGGAKLQNADFSRAIVDGSTLIWRCEVDRKTKFEIVELDAARIYPGIKQLLEYNIRRKNWERWYKEHHFLKLLVKAFWWISDYGLSTKRIIFTFLGLALFFAAVYSIFAFLSPPGIVSNLEIEPHLPLWHYGLLVFLRPIYFSIVTMTTLGFGDMYAYAQSIWGHILLTIQVILGYVLLGALITRFAVLFTAGGPAGKFADEKGEKDGRKSRSKY